MSASQGEPERAATQPDAEADGGQWVSAHIGRDRYRCEVSARSHALIADEPVALGGTDAGATPYEYLLAALGACTAITLRMYADRKAWPLEGVEVRLRTARSHEKDCEVCETEAVGARQLEREVVLEGPLTEEQRQRLLLIADRCPVKQTLEGGIRIVGAVPA